MNLLSHVYLTAKTLHIHHKTSISVNGGGKYKGREAEKERSKHNNEHKKRELEERVTFACALHGIFRDYDHQ